MARRCLRSHGAVLSIAIAFIVPTALRADDASDRYAVAAAHYSAQRWELAVEEFRALVKEHPDDPQSIKSLFFLGEALVQLGKHGEARAEFQRFLARDPDSAYAAQALFRSGESAFLAGDRVAARQTLEQFCKQHPNDKLKSFALMYLGKIAATEKRWTEAARMFAEVLESKPDPPLVEKVRYLLADAQYQSGDFTAAIATLEAGRKFESTADKQSGRDAFASRYLLALAYQGAKRDAEALAILDALAETASGDQVDKVKLARASSFITLERFAPAAESLESYLSAQPRGEFSARALGQLAVCQLHLDQKDQAAATLDRLLALSPKGPAAAEAAWNRGQILERLGKFDAAIASYQLIIDKHASSERFADAVLATARLQNQLHQYQQATELYQRLLRERPKSTQLDAACYGMAWALRDEGKQAESTEQFQKLHDEFRTSQFWNDAAFRLAEDAFAAKQNERAAKLVEELLGAKPPADLMAHALYLKAELETAAEKWDRVAADMSQLARDFPDSPLRLPAEYWVAEAAYRQGQFEEAGKRFASLADQIGGRQEKWLAMIPLRRAQLLAQGKKWSEAQAMAAGIEKEFPGFSEQYEVDYLLGRAAAAQADFEAARRYYNKTVRSTTGGKTETAAMAQWMIGETYFHQDDFEAALREYLRVEILYPYPRWQAAALLQAGKCQEAVGRKKDAIELYAKLIKVYRNTEFTDEAAKRLHDLESATAAGNVKAVK